MWILLHFFGPRVDEGMRLTKAAEKADAKDEEPDAEVTPKKAPLVVDEDGFARDDQ